MFGLLKFIEATELPYFHACGFKSGGCCCIYTKQTRFVNTIIMRTRITKNKTTNPIVAPFILH